MADAPTPLPLRPSAAERERALDALRERSMEGRLSIDTFAARVDRALHAHSRSELDALLADTRPPGPLRRACLRAVSWASALAADVRSAWAEPRVPPLALPGERPTPVTIGRDRDCDCVLSEPSVSRRHAELRWDGERWLLRDVGSRNGTRVNGMRVLDEVEVVPGDRVSFGGARYRLRSAR